MMGEREIKREREFRKISLILPHLYCSVAFLLAFVSGVWSAKEEFILKVASIFVFILVRINVSIHPESRYHHSVDFS